MVGAHAFDDGAPAGGVLEQGSDVVKEDAGLGKSGTSRIRDFRSCIGGLSYCNRRLARGAAVEAVQGECLGRIAVGYWGGWLGVAGMQPERRLMHLKKGEAPSAPEQHLTWKSSSLGWQRKREGPLRI